MAAPAKKGKHASAPRTAAATSAAAGAEAGLPVLSAGRLSALRAFSLAAAALSAYLAFLSLTQGVALGCGPESSCERVLSSRWAYWLGLPVSLFAVSVDGLLFGWSFHVGPGWPVERRRLAWTWLISLAVLVSGAALWFVGLQLFVMHSICPYCMAAHASGAIAAGLIFSAAPRGTSGASAAGGLATLLSRLPRLKVGLLLAFAGLAFLIAGQLLHQPKTFAEHPLPSGHAVSNRLALLTSSNAAVPSAAAATSATGLAVNRSTNLPSRLFPIFANQFLLDLYEVPISGTATNEHVIVSLFDYTCHHCRAMHESLMEVQKAFSERLVIASLPMPLDPGCNATMLRPNPKHTNACAYARLGLAVWRADRARHREFDDWLMAGETPPPLAAALEKAEQLVGQDRLSQASQDPWVERQIRFDVGLYEQTFRAGRGDMPQMIVGTNIALGTYPKAELFRLVTKNFGLNPPVNP